MPIYCHNRKKSSWSSARQGIVTISLASLTIALASVIPYKSVVAQDNNLLAAKVSTELPVVKSAALGTNMDVPWSQPVRIVDPFEGKYVGIFDRNYFFRRFLNSDARVEVVSLWSRNSVRFLLAYRDRDCSFNHSFDFSPYGARCFTFNPKTLNVTDLYIKIGEQVFRLEGENSTFKVSNELAAALKNSVSGKNVSIRLVAETGEAVDSEIGKGTVKAWKAIY